MKKLIQALQIFIKYKDVQFPTNCEHDELCIVEIKKEEVSDEDILLLDELGFFWSEESDCFKSFIYGSA